MPGDDSLSGVSGDHGSVLVQMSRMGERVAGLEARLEALKGDTETTRSSIHAINGELQKIVIVEEGCRQSLLHLTNQVTTLVNAAPAIHQKPCTIAYASRDDAPKTASITPIGSDPSHEHQ
jgi:hypothetical protein